MQTFMPSPDHEVSAQSLDRLRLGKQRLECCQILAALTERPDICGYPKSVPNHPCALMWQGYERELIVYTEAIIDEWISRGYKDTCMQKVEQFIQAVDELDLPWYEPPWIFDSKFHEMHRAALMRKDPVFYGKKFGHHTEITLEFVWPPATRLRSVPLARALHA